MIEQILRLSSLQPMKVPFKIVFKGNKSLPAAGFGPWTLWACPASFLSSCSQSPTIVVAFKVRPNPGLFVVHIESQVTTVTCVNRVWILPYPLSLQPFI